MNGNVVCYGSCLLQTAIDIQSHMKRLDKEVTLEALSPKFRA